MERFEIDMLPKDKEFEKTEPEDKKPDKSSPDPFEVIESEAIEQALKNKDDPDTRLKWIEVAKYIQERRKAVVELVNADYSARNAELDYKHQQTRYYATTLVPVVAVLITGFALIFQGIQLGINSRLQAAQNEDTHWRTLMQSVSFKDPKSALVGALSMQSFFNSDRYGTTSRSIAAALLPIIDNVSGFDEVLESLKRIGIDPNTSGKSKEEIQTQIAGVSRMLLMSARYQFDLDGSALATDIDVRAFLHHEVFAIDPNPSYENESQEMRNRVTAWELDSVSQDLSQLWAASIPPINVMGSVVLEDAAFAKDDFSAVDMTGSIFYDAHFDHARFENSILSQVTFRHISLSGANLRGAHIDGASFRAVDFRGADLSGITEFKNSNWYEKDKDNAAEWWTAKCISPDLYDYLVANAHPPDGSTPPRAKMLSGRSS